MEGNFVDEWHALVVGEVAGALSAQGMDADPRKDDRGDYLPEIVLFHHGRRWLVTVNPEEA